MNKTQESWIWLFLGAPMFLIPGGVAVLIAYDKGMSFAPLLMFAAVVIVGGLGWLLPFLVYKRKKQITFDERDRLIHKRAVLAAYVVLWLYFIAACVTAWLVVGPRGSISVNVMPLTLVGGVAIFTFAQIVATLIQYGRGGKE
jgi:membrane protease YdiL (CAAX protease family)